MIKKTVLITGAAKGIGRACAKLFAENDYQVAIHYHSSKERAKQLEEEIKQMGKSCALAYADISNPDQVRSMVQAVKAVYGPIDVLVNNAGIAQQKLLTDISDEEWKTMFAVNIDGVFYCCKAVLPDMISKKAGKIINISSIWGMVGASCEVHYSASKAAVIGFTKALAKEVGPSHITVNCVAPGVINTEMNNSLDAETIAALEEETPLGVIGCVDDIANTVYFLSSKQSDFITGQVISPNGGFVIS